MSNPSDCEIRKCVGDGWNLYYILGEHPMFKAHYKTEAEAIAASAGVIGGAA